MTFYSLNKIVKHNFVPAKIHLYQWTLDSFLNKVFTTHIKIFLYLLDKNKIKEKAKRM